MVWRGYLHPKLLRVIPCALHRLSAESSNGRLKQQNIEVNDLAHLTIVSLAVNPEGFEARLNLGGTLIALRQFDRALAENQRATEMQPHNAMARGQMGVPLFCLNRYDDAIVHLKTAKEIDMLFSDLCPVLSWRWHTKRRRGAALGEYEEFLISKPTQPVRAQAESRMHALHQAPPMSK
jgi:tetratricopeptide (TPR) repeat protein